MALPEYFVNRLRSGVFFDESNCGFALDGGSFQVEGDTLYDHTRLISGRNTLSSALHKS